MTYVRSCARIAPGGPLSCQSPTIRFGSAGARLTREKTMKIKFYPSMRTEISALMLVHIIRRGVTCFFLEEICRFNGSRRRTKLSKESSDGRSLGKGLRVSDEMMGMKRELMGEGRSI